MKKLAGVLAALGLFSGLGPAAPVQAAAPPAWTIGVRSDRLIYVPGSTGTCTVTVRNPGVATSGRLAVELRSGLTNFQVLAARELAPPPAEDPTVIVTLPFNSGGTEGGRELAATLTAADGTCITGSEYCLVTDNPVRMSHLVFHTAFNESVMKPGSDSEGGGGEAVQRFRDSYLGVVEQFAGNADDFALLAPPMERWLSGQTMYCMSRPALRKMIDAAHREGMVALTYCTKWIYGPYGFELARQHPDWFYWDSNWYGSVWNVKTLKRWALPWQDAIKGGQPGLMSITPLVTMPEVAEYGIDQMTASMRLFGFDGIRLDSGGWDAGVVRNADPRNAFGRHGYPDGQTDPDILGADLVRRIRADCGKANPRFIYGDNIGIGWGANLANAPRKMLAEAHAGGLVMEEGFNSWVHPEKGTGAKFTEVLNFLHTSCRGVRRAGGYPYVIGINGGPDDSPADAHALLAIAYASGAHGCFMPHESLLDYVRLNVRHAELFYDDGLIWIDQPERFVAVTSKDPVWWTEFVRARSTSDTDGQFIVHLINAPHHEQYSEKASAKVTLPNLDATEGAGPHESTPQSSTTAPASTAKRREFMPPPPPQTDIRVELHGAAGLEVKRAYVLSADPGVGARPLAVETTAGGVAVVVPNLAVWSVVVFEGAKTRRFPQAPEAFVAPPAEVTAGRPAPPAEGGGAHKPLAEEAQDTWRYWPGANLTNKFTNKDPDLIAPAVVTDKDTKTGEAVLLNARQTFRWHVYSAPPGKYRLTARLKIGGTAGAGSVGLGVLHLGADWTEKQRYSESALTVAPQDFKSANVYQDFVASLEIKPPQHVLFFTGDNSTADRLWLERLELKLLERAPCPAPLKTWRVEATGLPDPGAGDGQVADCEGGALSSELLPPGRYRVVSRVKRTQQGQDNLFGDVGGYSSGFWGVQASSFTPGVYESVVRPVELPGYGSIRMNFSGTPGLVVDRMDIEMTERYTERQALERAGTLSANATLIPKPGLQVWLAEGLFAKEAGIPDALAALKAEVTESWLSSNHGTFTLCGSVPTNFASGHEAEAQAVASVLGDKGEATAGDEPPSLSDSLEKPAPKARPAAGENRLMAHDLVILHDVPAWAIMDLRLRQAIAAFVRAGGGLLVTGGMFGLDRGGYQQSDLLGELLPVMLADEPTLGLLAKPEALTVGANAALAQGLDFSLHPAIGWMHRTTAKDGAKVELQAGGLPVLVTWQVGKGRVAVLTAPPYGIPPAGQPGYWQWPEWPKLMHRVLAWLAASK